MRMLRVSSSIICPVGCLAVPLGANLDKTIPSDVTVILDFRGPHSQVSLKEMQRETGLVLKSTGVWDARWAG
jgi:hypothetical protein